MMHADFTVSLVALPVLGGWLVWSRFQLGLLA